MQFFVRILLSSLIGGIVCAALGFFVFFAMVISDRGKVEEAIGFGLIVGIICAFIGACIGLAVGIFNLRVIGGAVVGFAAMLLIVAFYVLFIGSPGRYSYFLSESRIIFLVLSVPTILTGMITASFKNLLYKP